MMAELVQEVSEPEEPIYQIFLPSKSYQGLAEAGLTHRIKGLIASWVLSQKEDDFQNLMELELDLELNSKMSVEDWSVFWSKIWAQSRTVTE